MSNQFDYANIRDAAQGLLLKTIASLSKLDAEYVIVGGWPPYLRYNAKKLHPGTKDVDILFASGEKKGALEEAIETLLKCGYLLSAKHDFQLLLPLLVSHRTFVFNVDLLHPSETLNNPEIMVDHMELDVLERDDICHFAKSIALPESGFVFNGHVKSLEVSGTLPDSSVLTVDVPLIDEVGVFLTKFQSALNTKRPRDSFDIYLALTEAEDKPALVTAIKDHMSRSNRIQRHMPDFIDFVQDGSFDQNVFRFAKPEVLGTTTPGCDIMALLYQCCSASTVSKTFDCAKE